MAEKFLNQTGLQTYNDALQAKIAENYATKEYVNSIAGNAGLTFKIVDKLPGSLISIKDTMGMDLSGKTLIMKFHEGMETQATGTEGKEVSYALVTATGGNISELIPYHRSNTGGGASN